MPTIVARHTAHADANDTRAEVAGQQYGAQAATMTIVLDAIRTEHGSIDDYVVQAGLSREAIAGLRAALVTPAP